MENPFLRASSGPQAISHRFQTKEIALEELDEVSFELDLEAIGTEGSNTRAARPHVVATA